MDRAGMLHHDSLLGAGTATGTGMALDPAELYACYRRLERPLHNALYRWLWHAQDCQDLIHDAFLRVWDRRARIEAGTLDALVWKTALNLARNRLRWRRLWRFGEFDPLEPAIDDPHEEAVRMATQRRLRAALARLPRGQREVVVLTEFGGLDGAETAALLGIPVGTVGSRRHLALARLRAEFAEERHD